MRIGVNLRPTGDWSEMLATAQEAEARGFETVGFLDHYHTDKLEWPYICGWSAYGALAMTTSRIHLVPMVIDHLNYLPGVLAKEVSTLSILSHGRLELGIGAGDYFQEARAWGTEVPDAIARINGLKETITVLRNIWNGEQVTFEGTYLHLQNAACTPVPPTMPRVVIGAGNSRRLIRSAVQYADEINVYCEDEIIRFAHQEIEMAQRPVALSVFVWDWPEHIADKIVEWEKLGVERTFLTLWQPEQQLTEAMSFMA